MSVRLTRDDGAFLDLDGYKEIRYDRRFQATAHEVEEGSAITDHHRAEPLGFTIVGAHFTPAQLRAPRPLAVEEAITFFEGCEGKLIAVDTVRDGTILNCLLTACPHSQTVMMGRRFDLGFQQIRFATAVSVIIPPRTPSPRAGAGMADQVDAGSQVPAETTVTAQDEQTWAKAGYTVLGGS